LVLGVGGVVFSIAEALLEGVSERRTPPPPGVAVLEILQAFDIGVEEGDT
jgi:hypothetical protein